MIKTVSGYRRVTKVIQSELSSVPRIFDICYVTEDETLEKGYREDALHKVVDGSYVLCHNKTKRVDKIKPGDVLMLKNGCKGKVTNIITDTYCKCFRNISIPLNLTSRTSILQIMSVYRMRQFVKTKQNNFDMGLNLKALLGLQTQNEKIAEYKDFLKRKRDKPRDKFTW